MMERPIIICLTPVRNEAWILDIFLQCTSLWADYIIIADQLSTDGSKEIALRYPKVKLIENNCANFNEPERQALLIAEARKIPGKRLLITLDADELFTANCMETTDWQKMLQAAPGSVFGFNWINLLPEYREAWISDGCFPWAFMDDGSLHTGEQIHSPRVPLKNWNDIIPLKEIKVLHYQYVNWKRMLSKHLYYQCLERIKFPQKSAIEIFRMYHHMYETKKTIKIICLDKWFTSYETRGINVRKIKFDSSNWFDKEVLNMINENGAKKFQKECIWTGEQKNYDPRNIRDKLIQVWLQATKKIGKSILVLLGDKILKKIY